MCVYLLSDQDSQLPSDNGRVNLKHALEIAMGTKRMALVDAMAAAGAVIPDLVRLNLQSLNV